MPKLAYTLTQISAAAAIVPANNIILYSSLTNLTSSHDLTIDCYIMQAPPLKMPMVDLGYKKLEDNGEFNICTLSFKEAKYPPILKRPKSILFLFSLILNMSNDQECLTLLKKIVVAIYNRKILNFLI